MSADEFKKNVMKFGRVIAEVEDKHGVENAFAFIFTYLGFIIQKAQKHPTFEREEEAVIGGLMIALESNGYTSIITRDRDQKRMQPSEPFNEDIYPSEEIINKFANKLNDHQELLDFLGLDSEEVLEEGREMIAAGNLIIQANNRLADAGKHPEPSIVGFQQGISKIIQSGLENPTSYPSARNILLHCLNDLQSLKNKYVEE